MEVRQALSLGDIRSHNTPDDCWIAVSSKVWDVTDLLNNHPGGPEVILKYAGLDATSAYNEVHAPGMLEETLAAEKFIGDLLPSNDVPPPATILEAETAQSTSPQIQTQTQTQPPVTVQLPSRVPIVCEKPALHTLISAPDFQEVASHTLTAKAWAFYSSAATDLITHSLNKSLIRRILIRPRILRDVKHVSMKRKILGCDSTPPFFISPVAMARLAHPDGELALARAAGTKGIIQCIGSNASYPLSAIVGAGTKNQPSFLQLYVNVDRPKTADLLRKAVSLGVKAIFITVDAPVPGKREADERIAAETGVKSAISGAVAGNDKKGGGMGRLMAQYVERGLVWGDVEWIKKVSGLPVVLKGVQSAEDAVMAVRYGCEGVMISNHGGRSLDGAQKSILVLLEVHRICPQIFDSLEVYVDGGFEFGRPYLYSLTYDQEGVEHLTQSVILKDEFETSMRICGITDIDQAHPGLVNTLDVDYLVAKGAEHPYVRWKPRAEM
ncbi:FMN-dependent dehydrogenase-domain-containing protein [Clohesyomyces aquaticus]|uniref:FMN-dependent dehydrogenase-domain-containing protein n=1 Tax=Clohesyomyces aquaticus TaxID=1231657 RepID=A0A1Y1Y6K8_9PLEO|nr:FMN-dependent dehydrogenase-domain-containing protein [Clohesyomyces aquaticus]